METTQAIQWALTQTYTDDIGRTLPVTKDTAEGLVDRVRQYFNDHSITYSTFSYSDLEHYLN